MDAPTEKNVLVANTDICRICLKQSSRYTCPRCNTPYCTVSCYKSEKHQNCSETFYKENFLQALKETQGSQEDKRNILEILQRVEDSNKDLDSDDDSEEAAESLERRLAGLDLDQDADAVWERLNEKEKHEFETVLKAGKLGELLDAWTPWWIYHDRGLIIDLETQSDTKPLVEGDVSQAKENQSSEAGIPPESPRTPCPKIIDRIPKLSDLLKSSRPSDLVVYNLTNVLYCYAYIARLYNGAHHDLPVQTTQGILDLSQVLSANHNFHSTEEAVQSAINNITLNPAYFSSNLLSISILQDVVHILLGQSRDSPIEYTMAALSDLHELFRDAKKNLDKENKRGKTASEQNKIVKESSSKQSTNLQTMKKSQIFQCRKKIEFLLAWTYTCGKFLGPVATELQLIYKSRLANEEAHNKQQAEIEKLWDGEKRPAKSKNSLIQEL